MKISKAGYLGIILTVIFVMVLGWRFRNGVIEQDSYLDYAVKLSQGDYQSISFSESRLFPGLPLVLAALLKLGTSTEAAGWILTLSLFGLNMWLLFKLEESPKGWFVAFFPPIMLKQLSLLSSEALLLAGFSGAYLLVKKKWYGFAGLVLAGCWWVRAVSLMPLLSLILVLCWHRQWKDGLRVLLGAILIAVMWWGFNMTVLGVSSPTWQLEVYKEVGRGALAIPQLIRDVLRAVDWGWYRNVVAGIGYLVLLGLGWKQVWSVRHEFKEVESEFLVLSMILMSVFVFSWGPTPFLEEFPRFLVPVFLYLGFLVLKKIELKPSVTLGLAVLSAVVVMV